MGRYYFDNKNTVESSHKIDLRWLRKEGFLIGLHGGNISWSRNDQKTGSIGVFVDVYSEEKYMRLQYTHTDRDGNKTECDYKVPMVSTPCRFGGKRYWFLCPLQREHHPCLKRVLVLYLNRKYAGCRTCYNLTYTSRNVTRGGQFGVLSQYWQAQNKVEKLEGRCKTHYKGHITKRYKKYLDAWKKYKMLSGIASKTLDLF